jgi:hypothetical protein
LLLPIALAAATAIWLSCAEDKKEEGPVWECTIAEAEPDFAKQIGCMDDFLKVASEPIDASIPGARSAKTVIDRLDENALYFQNSNKYQIHWDFCFDQLSGDGLPPVPLLGQFNMTEYYSPDRRFLLGAITYYEGPDVWAYEIAPYDTSSQEMISEAYALIRDNSFFGEDLYFHPTSDNVATEAEKLPDWVKVITTDELFEGIVYQPLNLGTSMGQFHFFDIADLDDSYLTFRDIAVLNGVPNDISVVSGIITSEFQTPLSHINVLSQNRGTPNMAFKGIYDNPIMKMYDGYWVRIDVGPFNWSLTPVTKDEADAWWEENKPDAVVIPEMDLSVTEITDIQDVLELDTLSLEDALAAAIPAFGGKASQYGAFPHIGQELVPHPPAFGIPIYFYWQHMEANDLLTVAESMIADEDFQNDPAVRDAMLGDLRDSIKAAPLDADFETALWAKLRADFPCMRQRFRSSTNAEDLDGFSGAGLYTSRSGQIFDPLNPDCPVEDPDARVDDAVREVWASLWNFRAYDEREYRSIDHMGVGMAVLSHHSFPEEEANGVAVTANLFDTMGVEPGFYINVQVGEFSVVAPEPGVTTDQLLLLYDFPGQPIIYLAQSNLIPPDEDVLERDQILELGDALNAIHDFFAEVYWSGVPEDFYAMDVEFKFDDDDFGEGESAEPRLWVKQARPYPGWGLNNDN